MISVTSGQTCCGGAATYTSVSVVGRSAKRTGVVLLGMERSVAPLN
jgi:hypothetical protein